MTSAPSSALPNTVPCTRKHLHDGKPCGACEICQLAIHDPIYSVQWGVRERPEKPPANQRPYRSPLSLQKMSRPAERITTGVGTELAAIFLSAGFGGCGSCQQLQSDMNANGIEWCEKFSQKLVKNVLSNAGDFKLFSRVWAAYQLLTKEPALAARLATCITDECRIATMLNEAIRRAKAKQVADEYITLADMARHVTELIPALPADIGAVVGIARSGLIPAAMLSTMLHVPLYELSDDVYPIGSGWRSPPITKGRVPLIVDDSIASGRQLQAAKRTIRLASKDGIDWEHPLWLAMYPNPDHVNLLDFYHHPSPLPHFFEWNIANSGMASAWFAVDFDGILCQDIPAEWDDDGIRYSRAIATIGPKLPFRKFRIPLIVTARLEKYRDPTLAWLKRWGMSAEKMIMGPWANNSERAGVDIGAWKAEQFEASGLQMFIESDAQQARTIRRLTGRRVLCPSVGMIP